MLLFKSLLTPFYMLFYKIYIYFIKNVMIGRNSYIRRTSFKGRARIEDGCRISGNPLIVIGKNFYLNANCHLLGEIAIGDDVMIGPQTILWGRDHGIKKNKLMNQQKYNSKPIIIKNNVWIGANVTILKGVTIGEGAVIGAGSVVTKNIQSKHIVAGVPAKSIINNN